MKDLDEILAYFKPGREYVYGNPDTCRVSASDVKEWLDASAGIDLYEGGNNV